MQLLSYSTAEISQVPQRMPCSSKWVGEPDYAKVHFSLGNIVGFGKYKLT